MATNGNNLVIAEGTTKHVSFDNPVNDDRVIDEFLINLIIARYVSPLSLSR